MSDPLYQRIAAASRLKGSFVLRSGQMATHYFDKYRFEADPHLLRDVADRMIALMPEGVEVLAGMELGGIPLVTAMALASGMPSAFVRKEAKTYGTCRAVEGWPVAGRRVLIVEDVITTGGAVGDAVAMLTQEGAQIVGVVCAIWRGQGAPHIATLPELPVWAALQDDSL